MSDLLLSPEEISEIIQRDTKKWAIVNKEFLMDVAQLIAKAQLKKAHHNLATEIIQRLERMLAPEYKFSKYKMEPEDFEPQPTGDWILLNDQLDDLKKEFGVK